MAGAREQRFELEVKPQVLTLGSRLNKKINSVDFWKVMVVKQELREGLAGELYEEEEVRRLAARAL